VTGVRGQRLHLLRVAVLSDHDLDTPSTRNRCRGRLVRQIAEEPHLTDMRYNVELTEECMTHLWLRKLANTNRVRALREMSASENREDLATIGQLVAAGQVRDEHFPVVFNMPHCGSGAA
jgi:hypothetical protein